MCRINVIFVKETFIPVTDEQTIYYTYFLLYRNADFMGYKY